MAVLKECINDDDSNLSMLKRIWSDGAAGNLEGRILELLLDYWTGLAQQGRTLEEAAIAYGHPELAGGRWQRWWRRKGRGGGLLK